MTGTSRLALAFIAVSIVTSAARADVVFDNFGPGMSFPVAGRIIQGESVNNIGNVDQAASFITGSNEVFVTDVKLGIYVSSPVNSPFDGRGPLDIIIANNAAGLPGSAISTRTLNVNTYLDQVVSASFGGTVHLDPNTEYWIIADGKTTFDGAWEFNPINDFGPVAGRSNNGPWNLQNANEPRLVFQVSGRLGVPEPASLGLMAMLVGIGRFGRRRTGVF
jgi:hypothetical protein